jgi:mono/diheme cytochrome c family protein
MALFTGWKISVVLVITASWPALLAQTAGSVWDGIYTSAQADRGQALYHTSCASCHGDALDGKGQAPPLTGADFQMNWNGQTVGDLFDKMQSSMPADQPGTLKPAENAAILAFILKSNAFPAGNKELPAEIGALQKFKFDAAKPGKETK